MKRPRPPIFLDEVLPDPGLVRSLLPPQGARLSYAFEDGLLQARLSLGLPVVAPTPLTTES